MSYDVEAEAGRLAGHIDIAKTHKQEGRYIREAIAAAYRAGRAAGAEECGARLDKKKFPHFADASYGRGFESGAADAAYTCRRHAERIRGEA